jgi:hypothetical protein
MTTTTNTQNTSNSAGNKLLNDALNSTKKYNSEKRMWQIVTNDNDVILTCKTEKGLDSNYKKYLKAIS